MINEANRAQRILEETIGICGVKSAAGTLETARETATHHFSITPE